MSDASTKAPADAESDSTAGERRGRWYGSHFVLAGLLTAALFGFEAVLFSHYYSGFKVLYFLHDGIFAPALKTFVLASASLVLTYIFILAAITAPFRLRLIYFAAFSFAVLAEYGYQDAFDRFSSPEDLANALYAANWQMASSAAEHYFPLSALLPCAGFLAALVAIRPIRRSGLRNLALVAACSCVFYSVTAYVTTNMFPTIGFNAMYRTAIGFPVNWYAGSLTHPAMAKYYLAPREKLEIVPAAAPANNIVFIVDESMRGDHLSLNGYGRETTPTLDRLNREGKLRNWGVAVSGTTCSINSNNLLLTGVNTLPDIAGNVFTYPTIFDYARAMGYKAYYFDGQVSTRWNGKAGDDLGTWVPASDLHVEHGYDADAEIARRVRAIVENSTGNFIWINKFGVHPPYHRSYPAEAEKWKPAAAEGDSSFELFADVDAAANTNNYDNAILYNSESFFSSLLAAGPARATYYVYTSDHGQNLGEDGRRVTHCSFTANEANVPLLIAALPEIMPAADTGFMASHENIFASLLDLMQVPDDRRPERYAVSLFKAKAGDSKPRTYFEGNLNSRHSNSIHRFDP